MQDSPSTSAVRDDAAAEARFEALWKAANEQPVRYLDTGADEEIDAAGAFGAWIGEVADACSAAGLIDEAATAELKAAAATVARILGTIPPEKLKAALASLAPDDPEDPDQPDDPVVVR